MTQVVRKFDYFAGRVITHTRHRSKSNYCIAELDNYQANRTVFADSINQLVNYVTKAVKDGKTVLLSRPLPALASSKRSLMAAIMKYQTAGEETEEEMPQKYMPLDQEDQKLLRDIFESNDSLKNPFDYQPPSE